ncbi:unnamed protein product [Nesidiocoris tenuis]|uniref:Uncharacterized protein n=1 Tax=Nesidiocoris tenuis TaxID=355587 RepID=A0A6H5FX50_9HEMI|nr:unnamed protein product [Nesidiocoris tenuis]
MSSSRCFFCRNSCPILPSRPQTLYLPSRECFSNVNASMPYLCDEQLRIPFSWVILCKSCVNHVSESVNLSLDLRCRGLPNSRKGNVEASTNSSPKKTNPVIEVGSSGLQTENDMLRNEVRSLNVEISLLLGRVKSAEGADHMKEMSASKIRAEELRNELEDYKTRARKSLKDKEALIQQLKSAHQTGPAAEAMEINQLRDDSPWIFLATYFSVLGRNSENNDDSRNELETVSSELEKYEERIEIERRRTEEAALRLETVREESAAEINSVRTLLRQEAERRLAAEENCRLHAEVSREFLKELHKVREDLTKQLALMSERFREKVTEVAALRRQITQRGDAKPSMADAKVSTLTQALVQKQAALETTTNERNQLRLELERLKVSGNRSTEKKNVNVE